MNADNDLKVKVTQLQDLLATLKQAETLFDQLKILNDLPIVQDYLKHSKSFQAFIKNLAPELEYAIKSVIAIGQGPIVFNMHNVGENDAQRLVQLFEQLMEIEIFYRHLGGIIGYHLTVLKFIISKQTSDLPDFETTRYIHPEGLNVGKNTPDVHLAVRWGIENIDKIAVVYPLGGAGDRLNLTEESTGAPLPAALLPFLGYTLLEGLIRELQAREYLAFKLFGKQTITPIAIMTSVEKNNHIHVLNICRMRHWFGRPSDSFYFFIQPVVPVITIEGNWSLSDSLTLTLKPCGHGVLWKLAEDQGVLNWFESLGRRQCIIRQINNPVAGTDNALCALIGIGCHEHRAFGFVSCERLLKSDEGTDVLIETKNGKNFDYRLTNIEYTDFAQRGIGEFPLKPGSSFSIYPTNTNILFADIPTIRECLKICPIPGQLINMKLKVPYINPYGEQSLVFGGRLESTMQNIADYIVDTFPHPLTKEEHIHRLRAFIIYNKRSKTISTTKKSFIPGESPYATPEQTYYDLVFNHYELLKQCQFHLPEWRKLEDYLLYGPSCIFLFHLALGPLYSIISQKIRGGKLALDAELQLEIAEVDIENLNLTGSLLIEAISPLGTTNDKGTVQYGNESRCSLKNITIRNKGINRKTPQMYWKNELQRIEAVKIILHEGAEFHSEGVVLEGAHVFEVPPYHRLVLLSQVNGQWTEELTPITTPTWLWHYSFDSQNQVLLQKVKC